MADTQNPYNLFSHIKTINHASTAVSTIPESKNRFTELGTNQKFNSPKIGQPGIGIGMPGLAKPNIGIKPSPSPQILGTGINFIAKPPPPPPSITSVNYKPPILGSSENPMSHPPYTVGLNRAPPPELKAVPPHPQPTYPSSSTAILSRNSIPTLPMIEPKAPVLNIHSVNESKVEKGAPINGNYTAATFLNPGVPAFNFSDVEMSTADDIKRGSELLIKNSDLYLDSMAKLWSPLTNYWTEVSKRTVNEMIHYDGKQAEWVKHIQNDLENANKTSINSFNDSLAQYSSCLNESAKALKESTQMMIDLSSEIKELKTSKLRDEKLVADITKALTFVKQPVTIDVTKTAEPVATSVEVSEKEFKKPKRLTKAGDKKKKKNETDATESDSSSESESSIQETNKKRKRATKKEAEAKRKELEEKKEAKRLEKLEKEEKAALTKEPVKSHEKIQQQATSRKVTGLDPREFATREFKPEDHYLGQYLKEDTSKDIIIACWYDPKDQNVPPKLKNKNFDYIHGYDDLRNTALHRAMDHIRPYWPPPDPNQQTEEQIQQSQQEQQNPESGDALNTWAEQPTQAEQQLQEAPVLVNAVDWDGGQEEILEPKKIQQPQHIKTKKQITNSDHDFEDNTNIIPEDDEEVV